MGIADNLTEKFGDIDSMKAKYQELKSKEQTGDLDDKGKSELAQLRAHFDK